MNMKVLSVPFPRTIFSEDDIEVIGGSGQQDQNVLELIEAEGFMLPEDHQREKREVYEWVADRDHDFDAQEVLMYLIWLACCSFNEDPTQEWFGE